jgi:mono/diheme cytochrome c family protein
MRALVTENIYLPRRGYNGFTFSATLAPGYDYVGEFVAFDPVKGTRAWAYRPPSGAPMTASALATAGGIVFGGTADRQFFALDAATGALLWQMRLSGDISGAPVTFEVGGKQYVAVGAGGRAAPTTTLGRLVGVDVPQGTGVMWVFALPDTLPTGAQGPAAAMPRTIPPPARTARTTGGPLRPASAGVFTPEQAARGEQIFTQACASCHGVEEHTGAALQVKWASQTLGDVFQQLSTTMPPASPGSLNPDGYASLLAFFLSRSGYTPGESQLSADLGTLRGIQVGAP